LADNRQLGGTDGSLHHPEHGARDVKDQMSRDILQVLDEAGIGIASATFEIVGLPVLKVDTVPKEQVH
jgi:hypothetical protein